MANLTVPKVAAMDAGVVTLTGTVSDADIAHAVRRALEWDVQVPDERIWTTVRNELTVQPEVPSPVDIQHAIRAAHGRRAEGASKHVHIVVSEGRVLLSGHVRSAAEKQAILEAAKGTIGVRDIKSHIAIEP